MQKTKVITFRIDRGRLERLLIHVPTRYRTASNLIRHGIDRIIDDPEPYR